MRRVRDLRVRGVPGLAGEDERLPADERLRRAQREPLVARRQRHAVGGVEQPRDLVALERSGQRYRVRDPELLHQRLQPRATAEPVRPHECQASRRPLGEHLRESLQKKVEALRVDVEPAHVHELGRGVVSLRSRRSRRGGGPASLGEDVRADAGRARARELGLARAERVERVEPRVQETPLHPEVEVLGPPLALREDAGLERSLEAHHRGFGLGDTHGPEVVGVVARVRVDDLRRERVDLLPQRAGQPAPDQGAELPLPGRLPAEHELVRLRQRAVERGRVLVRRRDPHIHARARLREREPEHGVRHAAAVEEVRVPVQYAHAVPAAGCAFSYRA